ncbi:hypothetical protein D3C81_2222630 [compost metagenome]
MDRGSTITAVGRIILATSMAAWVVLIFPFKLDSLLPGFGLILVCAFLYPNWSWGA